MLFNSKDFLIFLPVVTLIYFLLPKKLKMFWLLLASYYFYMCWNVKYVVLILFSTIITYLCSIVIEKIKKSSNDDKKKRIRKRFVLFLSLTLNLLVLFYFKYFNFAIDIFQQIFSAMKINLEIPAFDILLPVGISFYTFQALSYTIDVYRDEIPAEKNFFKYALFVSFFPQLVAGPIERSKNLLNQLDKPKKFDFNLFREGLLIMIWGFMLKMVLADRIAIFVDTIYGNYINYQGWYFIVVIILFTFQLYSDFYGYSLIAKGTARILGVDLMENFNAPFFSKSIGEFWRRWHISLSTWFKDYVYIPLGGSRKGKLRKNINQMIVFVTSGLWHGANLTYVIWGAINGLYLVIGEFFKPIRDKFVQIFKLNRHSFGHKFFQVLFVFILFCLPSIFFRSNSLSQAIEITKNMITTYNPWILFDGSLYTCGLDQRNFSLVIIGIIVLLVADYFKYKGICIHKEILKQDYWFRWLVIVFSILIILIFGIWGPGYDQNSFVYFQF